ncbi:DUF3718 domain-containing protein [Thalassotalea euphylliae]|uniref:DUF3718 domain-containing protein n=1 Tax=Thalassotalea euphylliae TaxID=1655234 RepID=UPI00363AC247
MNKVKVSAIAIITGLSMSAASTSALALDRQVEAALVKVCKSTLSDKPIRMKHAMEDYNLEAREVALNVMCNGEDIISFAANNGANKTASRLQSSIGGVDIIDVAAVNKINVTFEQ